MWHAILEGATEPSKTVSVVEAILSFVWPDKDTAKVLDQIDRPEVQFCDNQSADLRNKLQQLLFPEYDALVEGR